MSEPKPAEVQYRGYSKPRPLSRVAVMFLIVGILSGPMSIFVGFFFGFIDPNFDSKDTWAFIAMAITQLLLLVCGIGIFYELGKPNAPRGRGLVIGGIFGTLLWGIALLLHFGLGILR